MVDGKLKTYRLHKYLPKNYISRQVKQVLNLARIRN